MDLVCFLSLVVNGVTGGGFIYCAIMLEYLLSIGDCSGFN